MDIKPLSHKYKQGNYQKVSLERCLYEEIMGLILIYIKAPLYQSPVDEGLKGEVNYI